MIELKDKFIAIINIAKLMLGQQQLSENELEDLERLVFNSIMQFNEMLKSLKNKEDFFNLMKKYYIEEYIVAWKKRKESNHSRIECEIKEAYYVTGSKLLFNHGELKK